MARPFPAQSRSAVRSEHARSPPAGSSDAAPRPPAIPVHRENSGRVNVWIFQSPEFSVAPRSAARSAICSAERVVVPCCSIRAVMLASPGRSTGLTPLPACRTRFAATSGSPGLSLYRTVSPFESLSLCGTGRCNALAGPAFGASLRHSASSLTGSPLFFDGSFCSALGVATSAPRSCLPGTP